ncbi:hypothetical protein [Sorangium sp. So ce204]|uniref:hypothetical protein n=1 Tax=Sorangium sp. So ce204 TaxID=3133288 RepID=UPI003F60C71B
MSMYYSHLLVPLDPSLAFKAEAMTAFLEAAMSAGFVGKDPERFVRTDPEPVGSFVFTMSRGMPKAGKYRGRNPGSWLRPDSAEELCHSLENDDNVQATIWSELRPKRPPLLALEALQGGARIDMTQAQFDDVYYVAITCHRTQVPVSMSEGRDAEEAALDFGARMDLVDVPAYAIANYPHKAGHMVIAGIAAARSWVSITFGNYVFPPARLFEDLFSRERGLPFAVPDFTALAERYLGCDLRQTCHFC